MDHTPTPTDPAIVLVKHTPVRVVMAIVSSLSICGSLLIILSYILFKDLRTRARYILVHLSIADLGVGLSNLIGIIVNFDSYYMEAHNNASNHEGPATHIKNLCVTQAFFAIYFTLSSILWTSSLAVYMYFLIVHHQNTKQLKYFVWFSYVACYGLPLIVNFWLIFTHRLGYAPYDSAGWCSMIVRPPNFDVGVARPVDRYGVFFGYDLWVLLTFVLTVLLYTTVVCHVRQEHQQSKQISNSKGFWEAMHRIDYKFILIPVFFLVLRIWSFIVNLVLIYIHIPFHQLMPWTFQLFTYTSGIGDSAQGFVNSLLFVALTYKVRKRLFPFCYRRQNASYSESRSLISKSVSKNSTRNQSNVSNYSSNTTNSVIVKTKSKKDPNFGYSPETPPITPPPLSYTPVSGQSR